MIVDVVSPNPGRSRGRMGTMKTYARTAPEAYVPRACSCSSRVVTDAVDAKNPKPETKLVMIETVQKTWQSETHAVVKSIIGSPAGSGRPG
eukprot:1826735-Prymnesium_polylepis.1